MTRELEAAQPLSSDVIHDWTSFVSERDADGATRYFTDHHTTVRTEYASAKEALTAFSKAEGRKT